MQTEAGNLGGWRNLFLRDTGPFNKKMGGLELKGDFERMRSGRWWGAGGELAVAGRAGWGGNPRTKQLFPDHISVGVNVKFG